MNDQRGVKVKELVPYLPKHTVSSVLSNAPEGEGASSAEDRFQNGVLGQLRVVRRNARLIGAMSLGAVLITALVVFLQTPEYTSTATLLIERNTPQILDIQQIMPESFQDETETGYYKTQYELLKGRALAETVIKEQGLENSFLAERKTKRFGVAPDLSSAAKTFTAQFEKGMNAQRRREIGYADSDLTDNYLAHIEVSPVRGTRLVRVGFTSPDPTLSARVANAHALAYVRQGLKLLNNTNEEAERFLEGKLTELKRRVEKSEAALNAYRRDKGVVSLSDKGSEDVMVQKFDELNKDLTAAEAQRISLEAEERLVEGRHYDALPAVLGNPLIQQLKEEATKTESEYAEAAEEFKPGYPQLDQLHARVEDTNARLHKEVQNVVDGVQSAFRAAVTNENELRTAVEQQKALVLQQDDIAVQYGILSREVDTNRQLYNTVLQRMKETEVSADLRASNIFMVDKAEPPLHPSHPKRFEDLAISAILGLVVAIGTAFFRESLDDTLKSNREVEHFLQLPHLANLPNLPSSGKFGRALLDRLPSLFRTRLERKRNRLLLAWYAESYRVLRNYLTLSGTVKPLRVVLITSALNSEGKTVVAVNAAACFARAGMRVLLIDADLRRPRCHEMLKVRHECGLSQVLGGHANLAKAVVTTQIPGLSVMPAGEIPPDPAELLSYGKVLEVLTQLRDMFDFIVVDSAPTMLVSDIIPLSTLVDATLLVINSRTTRRRVAIEACSRLRSVGATLAGVVLNRVDAGSADCPYANYYCAHYGTSSTVDYDGVLNKETIFSPVVP